MYEAEAHVSHSLQKRRRRGFCGKLISRRRHFSAILHTQEVKKLNVSKIDGCHRHHHLCVWRSQSTQERKSFLQPSTFAVNYCHNTMQTTRKCHVEMKKNPSKTTMKNMSHISMHFYVIVRFIVYQTTWNSAMKLLSRQNNDSGRGRAAQ